MKINFKAKEFIYQALFAVVLFLIYSFDKHNKCFHLYSIVFFSFYLAVSLFISYVLVPKYFYTKKLAAFWTFIVVIFLGVYYVEEYVLEPLLVGGERAEHVSNIYYTLLSIFPIIFMMVGFKIAWDIVKKQQELDAMQRAVNESELRFLKSQINPHFLFNNLNNLYSYALDNSPQTPSIILELSSVLRYMLYDCKEDFVPLEKEIQHLKNFTALNELQIEGRGKVRFNTKNCRGSYKIAPLILMVFIENAFKHSTASQSELIEIDVDLSIKNNQLIFVCKNTFLENANTQNLSTGIGLENVNKRLQLLYPKAHKLNITTDNNCYIVHLTLNLSSQ
ncbi:Histidine kinase [Tenacibaculum sp. 190130A14a]|uniref:Histidine kinase n=1 Tax=Tenacibaculum polynesiense TaxID=3137857 RepID=A0ABM9P8E4_9FLAO